MIVVVVVLSSVLVDSLLLSLPIEPVTLHLIVGIDMKMYNFQKIHVLKSP